MVAFCQQCSQSLPFADMIIEDGEEKPAPGYECPHCEQPAVQKQESEAEAKEKQPNLPDQLVIKDGKILKPKDT